MRALLLTAVLLALMLSSTAGAAADKTAGWDDRAALRYLDERLGWWRQWPKAERDLGTHCISCHTSLPHTLASPALRAQLGATKRSAAEMAMIDDVVKRVYLWNLTAPFYPDQTAGIPKSSESRGVEAVLNALVLATRDQERGQLGPDTRQAFANLWAIQLQRGDQKGGFAWLNFKLEPFESPTATYWGATLAALAVARAPGYAADPAVADKVEALRAYLRTGVTGALYTRALILWADSALPGILSPEQKAKVIADISAAQSKDGGWSLPSLSGWQRIDGSSLPNTSDGYATATMALVLRESGLAATTPTLRAARAWIVAHQDRTTGAVAARSINKDRQPGTDAYLFMTDEATGMAALAMRAEP